MSPPPPFSSTGHDSLLPWSLDHPDAPLDQGTKEERIRMLEREFAGVHPAFEPEPKPETLVGTADANGNLITQGPRKRLASRITQILLALAAAIPAIYAAVVSPVVNVSASLFLNYRLGNKNYSQTHTIWDSCCICSLCCIVRNISRPVLLLRHPSMFSQACQAGTRGHTWSRRYGPSWSEPKEEKGQEGQEWLSTAGCACQLDCRSINVPAATG